MQQPGYVQYNRFLQQFYQSQLRHKQNLKRRKRNLEQHLPKPWRYAFITKIGVSFLIHGLQVDSEKKTEESAEKTDAKSAGDKAADKSTAEDADKEKEKKEEALFEMLDNPARAVPAQVCFWYA